MTGRKKLQNTVVIVACELVIKKVILTHMKVNFCKMHALGNDFMVMDSIRQKIKLSPELIRKWSERRTGVGFDQLLLIEEHPPTNADFTYRIFNADGNEVEQCGNGARCVARFIFDSGLTKKKVLKLKTCNGLITTKLIRRDWIKVSLAVPDFTPPMMASGIPHDNPDFNYVSVGNPHAVQQVADVNTVNVAELSSQLQQYFPKGINVEFMQIINRNEIKLRVWERGVGETPACGSGACAAVVMAQQQGLLDPIVKVQLGGGELEVEWHGATTPVYLTGPAVWSYDGLINS